MEAGSRWSPWCLNHRDTPKAEWKPPPEGRELRQATHTSLPPEGGAEHQKPRNRPVFETAYGIFDPVYLASASWGGQLLCSALYEGLFARSPIGTALPRLVAHTARRSDARVWQFHLALPAQDGKAQPRPDAVAVARRLRQVFAASEAILASPDISSSARSTIGSYGRWIADINAFSAHVVEIRGHVPIPLLPEALTEPALRIPLSEPTQTEAQPGDGPMALVETPSDYRPGADDIDLRGTFFDLIPRHGALRRQVQRPIEMVALPKASRRTEALRTGHIDVAINIRGAAPPEGATVLTHPGETGLALAISPQIAGDEPGKMARALRTWLTQARVLDRETTHGTRPGRNLPMRRSYCRQDTGTNRGTNARQVLTRLAPSGRIRCATPRRFGKVALAISEALHKTGWDVTVVGNNEEAELALHRIAESNDPRIALMRVLQDRRTGGRQDMSIGSATAQQGMNLMFASPERRVVLEQACHVAGWVENHHPWAVLGWPRQASAVNRELEAAAARDLDPNNLDNVVERWKAR